MIMVRCSGMVKFGLIIPKIRLTRTTIFAFQWLIINNQVESQNKITIQKNGSLQIWIVSFLYINQTK